MVIVISTVSTKEAFAIFADDKCIVSAVFWHLHLLYLLPVYSKSFIEKTRSGFYIYSKTIYLLLVVRIGFLILLCLTSGVAAVNE